MSEKHISHIGTVKNISNNFIEVQIEPESACGSCKAKHICGVDGNSQKIIRVEKNTGDFTLDEKVKVSITPSMGAWAVFYAYILPLLVMFTMMLIAYESDLSELFTGLIIVVSLVVYFFLLFIFRNELNKKFSFTIEKL
ncbi:MAG TPA: SoxR reducing system RseC family protein [Bacteroidales bacterium]|nr:SoxR reducing system RseC family protein [Bacteroidales bacterium]